MPVMQSVVYVLEYTSLCCDHSWFTAYCHALNNTLEGLAINVAIERKRVVLLMPAIKLPML